MKTVRLTMAQALVRFLENQYLEVEALSTALSGAFLSSPATATWWVSARR